MTHTELIDQMKNEIAAYNAAFTARRNAQQKFADIANDDTATEQAYETAAEEMQNCNIQFARLDQAMWISAEKALGKGRELGKFFDAIAKMR